MSTQHMLLTNQQLSSRPDSIQIVEDYGKLKIVISEDPWETLEGWRTAPTILSNTIKIYARSTK